MPSTNCRRSAHLSPPAIHPASRGWAFRSSPNPMPAWAWPGSTASGRATPPPCPPAWRWPPPGTCASPMPAAQPSPRTREPGNGRNFEYLGEDPLLAGMLAGETIRAIQDQHVMSTVKHYALNAQETQQSAVGVTISEAAARESDLLAFEIAIERGNPGAVMCSYNHFNGPFACGSDFLLNKVLKQDWRYPGFVMSDWGAPHAPSDALAGLARESGEEFDPQIYFGAPLAALDGKDTAYATRITDMNQRIFRSMIASHLLDGPARIGTPDIARGEAAARAEAAAGIVLL